MALNRGKAFEDKFREDWKKDFPNTLVYRLADQVTGYRTTSQNPCDFICFPGKKIFMVECKSFKGASISFSAIPQYERLLKYKKLRNVVPGVVFWFREKDLILWADIHTLEKIYIDGNKSVQLRMFTSGEYDLKEIPAVKKRVYLEADYTQLVDLYEGR